MTEPAFAPDRVLDWMKTAMDQVVAAAGSLGVAIPSVRRIGTGSIPQDCAEVTIAVTQITTGTPEARSGAAGVGTYPNIESSVTLWTVTVQFSIVRATNDTPGGQLGTVPVSSTSYTANVVNASNDAAVLLEAARLIVEGNVSVGAGQRSLTFATPQGGLVATNMRLTATI